MTVERSLLELMSGFRLMPTDHEDKAFVLEFLLRYADKFGEVGLMDEFFYRPYGRDEWNRRLTRRMLEGSTVVSSDYHTFRMDNGKTPDECYHEKSGGWPDPSHPMIKCANQYYVIESIAAYIA